MARLGSDACRYPHLLADAHGWCLRLGPDPRKDDKLYSRLEFLFEGLIEQGLRRGLPGMRTSNTVEELLGELRTGIRAMRSLGRSAERTIQELHRRQSSATEPLEPISEAPRVFPFPAAALNAFRCKRGDEP